MAYYKGAQESDAFVKAITMSGNAAGVTAGQIAIMTQTVSKMSGSTVGASADALAQFAASGDISASRMADLTASAIKFERVGGAAIKDTVAAFVALAKDPVAASEDLTKKYNYLTDAVYVQIKALVEQGDKAGAVAFASNELAAAQNRMANEIAANLGIAEQAWLGVSGAAKKAWDAMLGIGRTADPAVAICEKIAALQADIAGGPQGFNGLELARQKEQLAGLKSQLRTLLSHCFKGVWQSTVARMVSSIGSSLESVTLHPDTV
jgi:phage-related minor tail protein